ncbi:Nephrin-like protein [Dinothrombium tinctorium]|uniref:Nephrin-like protein n=1 Tax=Dinothrombium tinctorium TaxID=1965070 RepID=A0A443RHY7_9ACAR|nr:Nephrin-like protein [Dinothrombium tinctorium]
MPISDPLPFLVWYSKEEIIDESWTRGPEEVVVNQLSLSLARVHLLTDFTCKAALDNYVHAKYASLIVDMNLRPLEVKIIALKDKIIANRKAEFQCLSYGSKPPVTITWFLDKQRLLGSSDENLDNGNVTRSSVSFVPLPEDNGKHIICKAENINFNQNAITKEMLLDIFCKHNRM